MGKRFFSDDSLERAILKGARDFGVEVDELAYTKIEKRHGFLKGRSRVVIQVDEENFRGGVAEQPETAPAESEPEEKEPMPLVAETTESPTEIEAEIETEIETEVREPVAAESLWTVGEAAEEAEEEVEPEPATEEADPGEPAAEAQPAQTTAEAQPARTTGLVELPDEPKRATERFPAAEGPLADAARQGLQELFGLADLDLDSQVLQGEERFEIELSGVDQEKLLEDRGRLLLSIQHLLPRLMRGIAGESLACRVDCDNFQEVRAEKLRDAAQRAASEVALKGRARTLEPMSPDERRIVHLTLADDATVETISKGEGLFKRVTVRPAGSKPQGFDPYRR